MPPARASGKPEHTAMHFSEFLEAILIRYIYGKMACARYGRRSLGRVDRHF
jgi:hypothetical protein